MEHLSEIRAAVLAWFDRHGRDLPWRRTGDPYAILVAETMLQQTQVDRVVPRWSQFLERFPDVEALAAASAGDVIREWSGLGYNGRALRLHAAAVAVVERHEGVIPRDEAALRALPGVGPYTAAAVRCFAFEEPVALVDTNHRRVLGRLFVGPRPAAVDVRAIDAIAVEALPEDAAWAWNQALMDLGATVCTARSPACDRCPVARWCPSRVRAGVREAPASYVVSRQPKFEGSNRWRRGRIVRLLGERVGAVSVGELAVVVGGEAEAVARAVEGLARDGLVVWEGDGVRLV